MTMREYYNMSIKDSVALRNKVVTLGKFLRREFIPEYYRHANVFKYENNVYYVDREIGIIDIK